jgi:hypothetical protein
MGTLTRVCRVIQYNYMQDFSLLKSQEAFEVHRNNLPSLGFNSLGDDYKDKRGAL